MAKFRLKEALVPKLVERKVVSPTTGRIKMRVHYKENRITGVRCVEFEFYPSDVIETNNPFGIEVLSNKASPRLKQGADWFISDPAVPWFEVVPDATPTTLVMEQAGAEIMTLTHRRLVNDYAHDKHVSVPNPLEATLSNAALLQLARQYRQEKLSAR
jgi:hypothetical protein